MRLCGPNIEDRFWPRVKKTDSCWLWTGPPMAVGYGTFGYNGRDRYAHRVSWETHHGPIPEGACVLHKCDVRLCVNPSHLFLGTRTDNQSDAARKGRMPHGKKHWNHKLTEDDVRWIAQKIQEGKAHAEIARVFNVSRQAVTNIAMRRCWRRVTGEVVPA